ARENRGEKWTGKRLPDDLRQLPSRVFAAPAKLELELQELSEEDRQTFMEGLGLKDFSRDDTLRNLFAAMGMIVFFTIGEDECRAWAIPKGASAVEGAGQVQPEFAAGFVGGTGEGVSA